LGRVSLGKDGEEKKKLWASPWTLLSVVEMASYLFTLKDLSQTRRLLNKAKQVAFTIIEIHCWWYNRCLACLYSNYIEVSLR
jgi:hypothetical protein